MAVAGIAGGMIFKPWWQRLLCFLGMGGLAYFAWIFTVFEFVKRTRPSLEGADGDPAPLERWGNRWMSITFAALAIVLGLGVCETLTADGWAERIAVLVTTGGAVAFAGMGTIFCFCAIPQIRAAKPTQR